MIHCRLDMARVAVTASAIMQWRKPHAMRPLKAGERPNGRRGKCRVATRPEATPALEAAKQITTRR